MTPSVMQLRMLTPKLADFDELRESYWILGNKGTIEIWSQEYKPKKASLI